jgi:type I restriction enzyme, S subunit
MSKSNGSWKRVPIKEIYRGFYDGPHATPTPTDRGPIFLSIKNITEDGHLDLSDVKHISEQEFPRWTKRVLPQQGDIVFTYEATLHRYAVIPKDFRGCLGRRVALIRPETQKIDTKFLLYYFFGNEWYSLIKEKTISGSTVDRIPLIDFPEFEIYLPLLPIQKKIAAVLSAYDDLIENNDRRITLLEKMAEEIYREWFVRLRFPGHDRATFHKGIPQGWKIQSLKEITRINEKSVMKGKEPKTINYIDIGSVTTNRINNIEEINFNDAPGRARRIVRHGDTIWSTVRPANRAYCLILDPMQNLIASTGFAVMSPKKHIPYSFLHWATTSDTFVEHISNVAKGSAYPAAGKEDFEKSEILIPSEELLWEFHALCEPMLKQKHTLAERNKNLKQTRDRLLTRLISGKLSVEDLDIQFPPSMTTNS